MSHEIDRRTFVKRSAQTAAMAMASSTRANDDPHGARGQSGGQPITTQSESRRNKLWYEKPATEWREGLPIGTGRLAAMVLGQIGTDRLALNHEWLWRGNNQSRDTEPRAHLLQEVRRLLLAGKYAEGTLLANKAFGGGGGILQSAVKAEKFGLPVKTSRVDPYQPAGDLYYELEHGPGQNYRRELDLNTASVLVSYDTPLGRVTRDYIAHPAHDLIIVRAAAAFGKLSGRFWLGRVDDPECRLHFDAFDRTLVMDGLFQDGLDFRIEATFRIKGGALTLAGNHALIHNAQEILVFLNIGTSGKKEAPSAECGRHSEPDDDWALLFESHRRAYSKVMDRLALDIPGGNYNIPTDRLVELATKGEWNSSLPVLYFNYGRYLLYSSSAAADLPANLQGKWNQHLNPPWDSDYHFDINLQFSYWLAEPANLPEYTEQLLPMFTIRKYRKNKHPSEGAGQMRRAVAF